MLVAMSADALIGECEVATGENGSASEPLACVSCRARKLKCDRTVPACTRCTRANTDCVYPESRRKSAFKRRNVRELEARLGMFPQTGLHVARVEPIS